MYQNHKKCLQYSEYWSVHLEYRDNWDTVSVDSYYEFLAKNSTKPVIKQETKYFKIISPHYKKKKNS